MSKARSSSGDMKSGLIVKKKIFYFVAVIVHTNVNTQSIKKEYLWTTYHTKNQFVLLSTFLLKVNNLLVI